MKRLPVQGLCETCGMSGHAVLEGEQATTRLSAAAIFRHPVCGHVQWYRAGGTLFKPVLWRCPNCHAVLGERVVA